MAGINNLLELSKRALLAYQGAMNTVGHNVANAQTPGYSRQRVDLRATGVQEGRWYLGLGVRLEAVERVRDRFLEAQILEQTARWGRFEGQRALLDRIESLFVLHSEGSLEAALSRFWSAWSDLAQQPEAMAARLAVREAALSLQHSFRTYARHLNGVREQAAEQVQEAIARVNELLRQIASLNAREYASRLQGVVDNTTLDERDRLVRELARYLEVSTQLDPETGMLRLFTGGLWLVEADKAESLELSLDSTTGTFSLRLRQHQLELQPRQGELAGLRELLNAFLPELRARLDALAQGLVSTVNVLHASGYTLDNQTGILFFDPAGTTAATIQLNSAVLADPSRIAASDQPNEPGNNAVARAIAGLRTQKLFQAGTQTPGEFAVSLQALVGARARETRAQAEQQQAILEHLNTVQDSISGVSLDEEMTHLIRYQQAYAASAKVLRTVQEMLETLLSLK
ncbi:MAG: flagellar hook-associated protein FlgK [Bacteroidota bacterium]|nr:flagellar hook-associated protein FlgK [Bacteroidota bacterium]MDW8137891.1 flagellar hook-associated protein FlgK [Bacteroidota bacterium]